MTIKQKLSMACVGLMMGVGLVSCGGGTPNEQFFSFQSLNLTTRAEGADNDTMKDSIPDFNGLWDINVSGIIPIKVGGYELTALNDTLGAMSFTDLTTAPAVIQLPADFKPLSQGVSDSVVAKSKLVKRITLDLLNPRVAVFRVYTYVYSEGAPHGIYSNLFVNYDVQGGSVIDLSNLFVPGYERTLQPAIVSKLKESHAQLLLDDDEINITPNFRITEDGVEFIYGIYSVAPYSEGEPIVSFTPYELVNILSPAGKKMLDI